jgi:hypothetical protein
MEVIPLTFPRRHLPADRVVHDLEAGNLCPEGPGQPRHNMVLYLLRLYGGNGRCYFSSRIVP